MTTEKQSWLERPIHPALPGITNEILIFAAIILMTIVTRFYNLALSSCVEQRRILWEFAFVSV